MRAPEAAVRRRLIEDGEFGDRLAPSIDGLLVRHFESIEAATMHEQKLVAQHVAHCAQFADEAPALAQQARGRIGTAIAESLELWRDQPSCAASAPISCASSLLFRRTPNGAPLAKQRFGFGAEAVSVTITAPVAGSGASSRRQSRDLEPHGRP